MQQFQAQLLNDFVTHWQGLRQDGCIPSAADYLDRMEPKLVPNLMIFDVLEDDMLVRFQGAVITERRGMEQVGKSWFQLNPHLSAPNVMKDIWNGLKHPCGIWTEAHFVTSVQRGLRVEALSLPLAVKDGRPPRWVNISMGLNSMGFDERAMGWQGPIRIEWYDAGFGMPSAPPLPPS